MGLAVESEQVNQPGVPSHEEKLQQVARILASPAFRNAPLLQRFLEFITSKAANGHSDDIGEYVIATQVLGRPSGFDPAADTIVRTQAYRLRTKLKEYYESEGKSDPIVINIPKGHYVPSFGLRTDHRLPSASGELNPPDRLGEGDLDLIRVGDRNRRRAWVLAVSVIVGLVVFVGGFWLGSSWPSAGQSPSQDASISEPVGQFWSAFLSDRDVIVAYTNAVFLETETGDLLRFRGGAEADRGSLAGKEAVRETALNPALAEHAGALYYEDGFTGTGEVLGVHRLTTVLAAPGANVVVKRSRLVSAEDFRDHDVIFLGSPFENRVLAEMKFPQRFTFELPEGPPYLWRGLIVDSKGTSAESRSYKLERDPKNQVIRADYALFDVLPGPAPSRRIVILAGLTTSGTQGAAEFATSPAGLRRILETLGTDLERGKAFPAYFECLLRIEAAKGLDAMTAKYVLGNRVQSQE